MATIVVQHEVSEYGSWRPVYDDLAGLRSQYGCTAERVLRSPEDGNNLLVQHDFPTLKQAQDFTSCSELKEAMHRGGVSGAPRIELWEDIDV